MSRAGTRILLRATTRNGRRVFIGSALICAHQTCEAIVPILIGVIIDKAVEPTDGDALLRWVGVLAGLFLVLTTVYRQGARQLMAAIAQEGHQLRMEVSERILQSRGLKTDLPVGELLTVSTSDSDNVSYLLDYIPRIAGAIVATIVGAIALLVIDVPLGLLVLIGTPLVLVGLQLTSPLITKRVASQQELAGKATSLATDLVSGVRPLRGLGAERAATARYRLVSQESLRATLRAARTQGGYLAASTAASTLLACGIAVFAGYLALTGRITVGELITVIGLAQFLTEPFSLLAIVPSWVAEARASAERVAVVLAAEPLLAPGAAPVRSAPLGVELSGLRYSGLSLDLTVAPGELLGVVAARPADAEALVRLLSGRVAPDGYEGTVRLGGSPLADLDLDAARAALLVQPHRSDLFGGNIETNIRAGLSVADGTASDTALLDADEPATAGRPTATLDTARWEAVLRASAADEVISAHPDGLELQIIERGANLSGGQRQRLALARALLADAPVLVLHDPTTAMDSVTEHVIAQGIRTLRGDGRTTIVVASSPALLAITDRVVILDEGVVVAEGTHADLGVDHELYRTAVLR